MQANLGLMFERKAKISCNGGHDVGLKGQCHEDFAVLSQFYVKNITLRF